MNALLRLQLFACSLLVTIITSCQSNNGVRPASAAQEAQVENAAFTVDTLATGLRNPWGMVFLPDCRMLITERPGTIRIFKDGVLQKATVQGLPKIHVVGQGGLLDIELHPDYGKNGWLYFSYVKSGTGGFGTTLARAKLSGNTLTDVQDLFSVKPLETTDYHFGSRIVFDGKGHLFVTDGERGQKPMAQRLDNDLGKVIRLNDDGSVPQDNPFVNTPGAKPEIWSYGHRNVQGLVYDKDNDILWEHEHGPRGGDELNIVEKGKNYGWPVTTYGIDYDGSIISNYKEKEGIQGPVHQWTPSIAPCGMELVTSDRYAGWKGNLLVGALAYRYVARVTVKDRKFVSEEKLLVNVARMRCIKQGPDGFIYILTESPGMLLKLVPKEGGSK